MFLKLMVLLKDINSLDHNSLAAVTITRYELCRPAWAGLILCVVACVGPGWPESLPCLELPDIEGTGLVLAASVARMGTRG